MSSEDRALVERQALLERRVLLEKIGRVAGQINRAKNEQSGNSSSSGAPIRPTRTEPVFEPHPHRETDPSTGSNHVNRGGHQAGAPYPSPSYNNGRRPPHRNKTLIMNNSGQSTDTENGAASDASPTWISKSDRHLQLINSSVFEKEAQARAKAIETTRRQKARQRNEAERRKLMHHINRGENVFAANETSAARTYELVVNGIRFVVSTDGRKLIRVPGDNNPIKTPKVAVVGNVRFYRSKNGNLYRHAVIKAHRKSGIIKKIDVPCSQFSSTGSCPKGPMCRYMHDASKVAVCKDFLQKGDCVNGESCDLSHKLTPERTPACVHFARGNCSKSNCVYTHMTVPPGALVCRPFGLYGYCPKGSGCSERHVFECPDFSNTGRCNSKGCKLPHRERASVMRKAAEREASGGDEEMADLSSDDDDDSVGSDDVDSDEVDEFIEREENGHLDFSQGKDYIKF